MRRTSLVLSTPAGSRRWDDVVSLRLSTHSGQRGVQPGHEPATVGLVPGVVHVGRDVGGLRSESFLATEGGLAWIGRDEVVLVTRWSASADDLPTILESLQERRRSRRAAEREARHLLERHETATRRALIGLQREVHR